VTGCKFLVKRKCEECGVSLTEENVMKIKLENGSWQTIPIPLCPKCFTRALIKKDNETVNE